MIMDNVKNENENTKVHSYKSKHEEGLILQTLENTKEHSYKSKHAEGLTLQTLENTKNT